MIEALEFEFMRNALIAGLLTSVACGIIGTFVVLNRKVFISAGIAHAAYGGVGLGYYLRVNPLWTAMVFSLLAALGMGVVERSTKERSDTLIGVMWALGMAIGIILIDLTKGYKADLMSFLFGSVLTVATSDLICMAILDLVIVILVAIFHKELLALSFDELFATVQNVPVERLYYALICMIAITVVMLMRIVGLIMVIALLTMPAAISSAYVHDMRKMMVVATALGMLFTTVGLWLSFTLDLTSGATIILVATGFYFLSMARLSRVWRIMWKGRRSSAMPS